MPGGRRCIACTPTSACCRRSRRWDKPETSLARVPEAMALVPQCAEDLPIAFGQLASGVTLAQQWVGQLDEAESLMRAAFDEGVARDVPLMRGGSALRLGQIALWRGAPRTAAELLRESVSALRQFDAGFLAWAANTLCLAYALLGDLDRASDARRTADLALQFPLYTSERFRARRVGRRRRRTADAPRARSRPKAPSGPELMTTSCR